MSKITLLVLLIIVTLGIGINSAKGMHDERLHIVICDVGQGDGILVITPNKRFFLVDGGPDNKIEKCISKYKPFYDRHFDAILVSHFHADHIAGFIDLLKAYQVDSIIKDNLNYPSPEKSEFEKRALAENTQLHEAWQGDQITLDTAVTAHVLWPTKTTWNTGNGNWEAYLADFNDSSLVLLLKYKKVAVLLTGDVGFQILDSISQSKSFHELVKDTHIKIYKISHHGSRDADSKSMIAIFNPTVSVISAGKDNTFGHPHKEVIQTLKKNNLNYYVTSEHGAIDFNTDGEKLWVSTER